MKKTLFILSTALLFLTACNADEDKKSDSQKEQGIEVDKGLLDVELTLPADFFEGKHQKKFKQPPKKKVLKKLK